MGRVVAGLTREQHLVVVDGVGGQQCATLQAAVGADRGALAQRLGTGWRVVEPDDIGEARRRWQVFSPEVEGVLAFFG